MRVVFFRCAYYKGIDVCAFVANAAKVFKSLFRNSYSDGMCAPRRGAPSAKSCACFTVVVHSLHLTVLWRAEILPLIISVKTSSIHSIHVVYELGRGMVSYIFT